MSISITIHVQMHLHIGIKIFSLHIASYRQRYCMEVIKSREKSELMT